MKLEVEKVTKRFTRKGTPAVFETSFEAPSGGITTLLGPSGSGKTTLLRVVAGLEDADEGRVVVGGEEITHVPVRHRGFGFVFQTFALFDQLSVSENIGFGLRAQGIDEAVVRKRIEELLALVQLEGLGGRYPGQLSGGQRQRVGFARALAPHPKLLLLDEPFGALDARVRIELRAWLRELHRNTHVTTLLVTHDQDEALELSDRIVVMDRGRIEQIGTPREIYDQPKTPFVASFVGAANVLGGQARDGRAALGSVDVALPPHTPEGTRVRAIIRPHDVRLGPATGVEERKLGRVVRVIPLGPFVKVDVTTHQGNAITVHLSRQDFDRLHLDAGDRVMVDIDAARIFVDDYAI